MATDSVQRQFNENKEEHRLIMKEIKDINTTLVEIKILMARLPEEIIQEILRTGREEWANKETERWVNGFRSITRKVITSLVIAAVIALSGLLAAGYIHLNK